jgi:DNA repair protein RecN (Recombination protein N)
VYNTSGYERLEMVKLLDGIVDIYMPDLKYMDPKMSAKYSAGAADYPEVAQRAILEMHRQVGVLAENRQGAVSALRKSKNAMDEIIQIDSSLGAIGNQLQDAFYEIQDFTESIRAYKSAIEYDPDRLVQVEDRLALIHTLEKKYGDTIAEVLIYYEKSKKELGALENWENEKHVLEEQIKKTEQEFYAVAKELSEKRKKAAVLLQQQVEAELEKLGMARVKFRVLIQNKEPVNGSPVASQYGLDNIEFVIAANPGEPFKRLRAVASGGELSRVMLAIKTILAESDNIYTLIFDEVDAGIGGQVALQVGEHLKQLSRVKQVLCITHLATIAVRADNHLKVAKQVNDERTITQIEKLGEDKRREELSRMLAGDVTDKASLQHAEELMRKYSN